jgi:hypothetical protein
MENASLCMSILKNVPNLFLGVLAKFNAFSIRKRTTNRFTQILYVEFVIVYLHTRYIQGWISPSMMHKTWSDPITPGSNSAASFWFPAPAV